MEDFEQTRRTFLASIADDAHAEQTVGLLDKSDLRASVHRFVRKLREFWVVLYEVIPYRPSLDAPVNLLLFFGGHVVEDFEWRRIVLDAARTCYVAEILFLHGVEEFPLDFEQAVTHRRLVHGIHHQVHHVHHTILTEQSCRASYKFKTRDGVFRLDSKSTLDPLLVLVLVTQVEVDDVFHALHQADVLLLGGHDSLVDALLAL